MQHDHSDAAEQARLDAWLADSNPPPPPAALRTRILLACAPADAIRIGPLDALRAFWHGIGGLRIAAPAFALALAVGIALGSGLATMANDESGEDFMSLALAGDAYQTLLP